MWRQQWTEGEIGRGKWETDGRYNVIYRSEEKGGTKYVHSFGEHLHVEEIHMKIGLSGGLEMSDGKENFVCCPSQRERKNNLSKESKVLRAVL